MARYSRRTFPDANYDLTLSFANVPQATIGRAWDDGEILVLIAFRIRVTGVTQRIPSFRLTVDGVVHDTLVKADTIPASGIITHSSMYFVPVAAGFHTLTLQAEADAVQDQRIDLTSGYLIALQLPLWDSDADID